MDSLNRPKIEYVFHHLNQHINVDMIKKYIFCGEQNKPTKPAIFFPLSDKPLVKDFRIDNLPVLFPLSDERAFYQFDTCENLIFKHDLLKSAFYLLSGYQELDDYKGDHLKRFTYKESIQGELEIADWPIVNEYFQIIINGLKEFCKRHKIELIARKIWDGCDFAFFLTHDVDRIDKWTFAEIKNRIKMVVKSGFRHHWGDLFEAISYYPTKKNPYWNFNWLKKIEEKLLLNSTWFFLPQGRKHIDAYYSLSEPRVKELATYLENCGDKIALHGTYGSRENGTVMKNNLDAVQSLTAKPILFSRQHWLSFKNPVTLKILDDLGIEYDSSSAFAEHYGWRNSYCHPFNGYDFEQDKMMRIRELPLNAMDVTFFQYMQLSIDQTEQAICKMVETCRRYNGLFVLLWHNNHFDEKLYPGITLFYENILLKISNQKPFIL